MPFDIERKNDPVRCYFDKDRVEWVDLRIAEEEDLQAIRDELGIKPRMVYIPNPAKDNALEMVQEPISADTLAEFTKRLNFYGVAGWHLVDNSGNEIPYSMENVDRMIRRSKRFANFIEKHIRRLREDRAKEEEAEIKNS